MSIEKVAPAEPMEVSEEIFEVEAILDKRIISGKVSWTISW